MKLAAFLAIASSLLVIGGLYNVYNSMNEPTVSVPTPVYDSWMHWKQHHGKSYGNNAEEDYRLQMYAGNFDYIAKNEKPEHTFSMELNQFADMGLEEFLATYGGINGGLTSTADEE